MTVQAGAARLLLAQDPEQAREPILAVEETGREALAETRRLLGILRSYMAEAELEPQPGMASLETLVSRTRRAGLPVELTVEGDAGQARAGSSTSPPTGSSRRRSRTRSSTPGPRTRG